MANLFRKASVEHALKGNLDQNKLIQFRGLSGTQVTLLVSTVMLLLLFFLMSIEYSKKIRLPGVIRPASAQAHISAPVSGIITHSFTQVPTELKRQQLMFVISEVATDVPLEQFSATQKQSLHEEVNALQENTRQHSQTTKRREQQLQRQLSNLELEAASLQAELALLNTQIRMNEDNFSSWQQAAKDGLVSQLSVHDKENQILDLKIRSKHIERALLNIDNQRSKTEDQQQQLKLEQETHKLKAIGQLNQLNQQINDISNRQQHQIHAPVTGKLTSLKFKSGEQVNQGAMIASVAPEDDRLELLLLLKADAELKPQPGDTLQVELAAYPVQEHGFFQATIQEISDNPLPAADLQSLAVAVQPGQQYFLLTAMLAAVDTNGEQQTAVSLRAGMTAEAHLIVTRKSLLSWFLEPLMKVRHNLEGG
jgi:membrane fusion protein